MALNFPASPANGATHDDTSNGIRYIYNSTKNQWTALAEFTTGAIGAQKLDDLQSSFQGTNKVFTLKVDGSTVKPHDSRSITVYINNVIQRAETDYTVNNLTGQITFTSAPAATDTFYGIVLARLPLAVDQLPLNGGTMTGDINFSTTQVIPHDQIQSATTNRFGVTKLSDATDSTSTTLAATSKAVKDAKDAADAAASTANSALPKAGGTMTGDITFNSTQQFDGRDLSADGTKLDGIATSANNYSISSDLLDEDDMASDSDSKVASQQSIKAYVDAHTGATDLSYTASSRELASSTGTNVNLPEATTSAAGLQSSADKTKLDGIETAATADQTASEIKTAYESNSDTNAFTDADHTKLDGIETSATADQTASEIKTLLQSDKISTTEIADDAITNAKLNLVSTSSVPSLEAKGDGSSQDGYIQLNCSQNSHGVKIKSPPHSANASYTLTLPNNDGDSGQFLKTDGSGSLSWDTVSGGGGVSQNLIVTLTESIDGSRTDFTMSTTPATAQNLMVSINGVIQKPNAGTTISNSSEGYCISGSTLKFATAPASGSTVFVVAQTAGSGGSVDLSFNDNAKIKVGTGDDLQIYHDGSNSYIEDAGTGALIFKSNTLYLTGTNAANDLASFVEGGAVSLYFDDVKKFETYSNGVKATGNILTTTGDISCASDSQKITAGASDDLQIYHDGTNNIINTKTGSLLHQYNGTTVALQTDTRLGFQDNKKASFGTGNDLEIYHQSNENWIKAENGVTNFLLDNWIQFKNKADNETLFRAQPNGAFEAYYDNSKKFETISSGSQSTGDFIFKDSAGTTRWFFDPTNGRVQFYDNIALSFGNHNDLKLLHDGSNSYILDNGTGNLYIATNDFNVTNAAVTESFIKGVENGAVELYYDNVKKLETTALGVNADYYTGADNAQLRLGDSGDLQIYHDGNHSRILDNGTGYLLLQTNECRIHNVDATEIMAAFTENGAVALRYDNVQKIYTTSNGIQMEGDIRFNNSTWTGESTNGKIQTHGSHMYLQNAGGQWIFRDNGGTSQASISSSGTYSGSDARRKKDITTITSAVDTIKQLVGRSFTWKEDDKKSFGLIAQEVEPVLPELVTTQTVVPGETNSDPYKMVNYAALTGHLVEAIKELSTKVAALEGA